MVVQPPPAKGSLAGPGSIFLIDWRTTHEKKTIFPSVTLDMTA
jgi:hypothetical protein